MTFYNKSASIPAKGLIRHLTASAAAIIIGLLITETGLTLWTVDFTFLKAPAATCVMSVVLWCYWKYFSGSWPAGRTVATRKTRFRALRLPAAGWRQGLLAALAIVLVLETGMVLTFRLIPFPDRAFTYEYGGFVNMPPWQAWALVVMSSLVAGICEETGFRGYMQVPLERLWGRIPAILVTSVVFTALHLGKAWSWYIIPLIFLTSVLLGLLASRMGSLIPCIIAHTLFDVVNFSYWWSHLAGRFRTPTIFVTGLDIPFAVSFLVFAGGCILFFRTIKKGRPSGPPFSSYDAGNEMLI
jgi:membrane protease YdiL (CAAX protease family)